MDETCDQEETFGVPEDYQGITLLAAEELSDTYSRDFLLVLCFFLLFTMILTAIFISFWTLSCRLGYFHLICIKGLSHQ